MTSNVYKPVAIYPKGNPAPFNFMGAHPHLSGLPVFPTLPLGSLPFPHFFPKAHHDCKGHMESKVQSITELKEDTPTTMQPERTTNSHRTNNGQSKSKFDFRHLAESILAEKGEENKQDIEEEEEEVIDVEKEEDSNDGVKNEVDVEEVCDANGHDCTETHNTDRYL